MNGPRADFSMRPSNYDYPQSVYSDGKVHANITIDADLHKKLVEHLQKLNRYNRTEWIRMAIKEKLERDMK